MSINQIAEREDSTLEVFPPAQAPASLARQMLHEHARMYNDAWKLAGQLVKTTMVPKRFYGKQGDATAAILYGAELGLNPIQSLQRVIPIHGMPSLEARTMVGLLKSHGYGFRVVEQSDEAVEVWAWEPNSPKVYGEDPDDKLHYGKRINPDATSRWTIARAKQAGYVPTPVEGSKMRPDVDEDWVTVTKSGDWGSKTSVVGNMKYITDPQTMLKAKSYAEVSRELAPDVLMGISYTREELESEDQRQFDRMDERGAAPARVTTTRVTEEEIFAEEVPLSSDGIVGDNPPTAQEAPRYGDPETPAPATPETPAGDVTEDQGDGAPDPQPSPAAQPETVAEPTNRAQGQAIAEAEQRRSAREAIEENWPGSDQARADLASADQTPVAKKAPAKKAPAKKAAPRNVSKLRAPLEKRLFALLGDAGIAGDKDRDGRIAVYRAITGREDVASTDDLDDATVGKVCDQLYRWQADNELDDQIAGILADAAREAEETSAATAADPTSEGTE